MSLRFSALKYKDIVLAIFILICSLFINTLSYAHQKESSFIMLNLNWSDGKITLNSLKKVNGLFKRQQRTIKNKSYFFQVVSINDENIISDYFEIPLDLKYDALNRIKGSIEGGIITRDNLDFLLRVPHLGQTKEIRFFRCNSIYPAKEHPSSAFQPIDKGMTFLGAVSLDSF